MTEQRKSRETSNAILVSLLAGIAGAAVALLFAPKSGKETRENLKNSADEVLAQAQKELQSAKGSMGKTIHSSKDRLAEAIKHNARKADKGAEKIQNSDTPIINNWEDEV